MTDKYHNPKPKHVPEKLLRPGTDLTGCDDADLLNYHFRRVAFEQIELVREGRMRVDEKFLRGFKEINDSLRKLGKPTISFDFLD